MEIKIEQILFPCLLIISIFKDILNQIIYLKLKVKVSLLFLLDN